MTNRTIDVYAAGLIDGEGCIGIVERKGIYNIRIDVGMTVKAQPLLEMLEREYGGCVVLSRRATSKWDAAACWVIGGEKAAHALRRIEPYLQLKEEQARIAIKMEEIRQQLPAPKGVRFRWTEEARYRCAALKRRMHELNQKGPSTPQQEKTSPVARLVAGTWVTNQADLFSDLGWAAFSGPWPRSGSMRSGRVYQRPLWERHTEGTGGSSLLPTPRTSDTNGAGRHGDGGMDLRTAATLLPTPAASRSGRQRSESGGAAVRPSLDQVDKLLPTPTATDAANSRNATANRSTTGHHSGVTLTDAFVSATTGPQSPTGSPFSNVPPHHPHSEDDAAETY